MWNICALCAREPVAEPISTTAGTYTQTHRSHIGYNNFDYNTFTNKMTMLNIMEIFTITKHLSLVLYRIYVLVCTYT